MAEYHFMTYSTHIQLCDGERARYGTTDPAGVSCDACKQTSEWQAAAKARGIEMPKDPKTTVEDLRRTANELLARAAEIEREEKEKAGPEEPPMKAGTTFKLLVQFRGGSHTYTYLLVRKPGPVGGPWFTTGTGDTGYFKNWGDLVEWLRSDNIVGHSALIRVAEAERKTSYDPKVRYHLGGKQR
jgi:hypothetical protein